MNISLFFTILLNDCGGNEQVTLRTETYHRIFNSSFRGLIARKLPTVLSRKLIPDNQLKERIFSLSRMVDAGIVDHLASNALRPVVESLIRNVTVAGPKVLTIEHLAFGFKFSLFPLTIAAVIFIIEWAIPRVKVHLSIT